MNLTEPLRRHARERPDAPAIVRPGGALLPWGDADRLVDHLARRCRDEGIVPGEVVSLAIRGPFRLLMLELALMRLGAAPMTAQLGPAYATRCLSDEAAGTDHPSPCVVDPSWFEWEASRAMPPFAAHPGGESIAIVCPSSGTTGVPKAIPVSHDAMAARLAVADRGVPLPPAPRQLCLGTITAYGILSALRVLRAGGTVVVARSEDVVDAIARHRVNRIALMPWSVRRVLESLPRGSTALASLEQLEVGGEYLPEPLYRMARERLCRRVYSVYGAAECGNIATGAFDDLDLGRGEAGRVSAGVEVATFDVDGTPLPDGAEGIVGVRNAGCAQRYALDDASTAASFRDGWFISGDIGRVDAERRLFLTGRTGELVNLGGIKVAFRTIEDVARSVKDVADAAAFGAPAADGIMHVGLAIVARRPCDRNTIETAFRMKLPSFLPSVILSMRELPRGGGGKVLRRELASLAVAQGFGAVS